MQVNNELNDGTSVYESELKNIFLHGTDHEDRTGVGRRSVYGRQFRFDLSKGFPLITTKKVSIDNIIKETLWFLSGSMRSLDLQEQGVNIWKQWTPTKEDADAFYEKLKHQPHLSGMKSLIKDHLYERVGTIGPLYGSVWRGKYGIGRKPDQIANLIKGLQERPFHSRHCVTAWIPELLPLPHLSPKENVLVGNGALAPCHFFFQCFVKEPVKEGGRLRLSMNINIRSMDFPIGTPYNVAQYALLLMMIAQVVNMDCDELIVTGGDCHIYSDQLPLVPEQLSRQPFEYPQMKINPNVADIDDFKFTDFELVGYQHHPFIKYPVAT